MNIGVFGGKKDGHILRLYFLGVVSNERMIQALVDTRALHNFMRIDVAKELGSKVVACMVAVKLIKSKVKALKGVSSSIHIQVGDWHRCVSFIVLLMDDFEAILGEYFLEVNKVILVTWLD